MQYDYSDQQGRYFVSWSYSRCYYGSYYYYYNCGTYDYDTYYCGCRYRGYLPPAQLQPLQQPQPALPPLSPGPACSVTYHANGGSGGFINSGIPAGSPYTVRTIGETAITRSGFLFAAWNTAPDGGGATYTPGSVISMDSDLTLYAQWTAQQPGTYSVTYHMHPPFGGDETCQTAPLPVGYSHTVLAYPLTGLADVPAYSFRHWNSQPDGAGAAYDAGDRAAFTQDTPLYAMWEADMP